MLLDVSDLWKSYPGEAGDIPVLRGVGLTLAAGRTLALTGESGSGKSTLLHLVGGLDIPDRGRVLIDGKDIMGTGDADRAARALADDPGALVLIENRWRESLGERLAGAVVRADLEYFNYNRGKMATAQLLTRDDARWAACDAG